MLIKEEVLNLGDVVQAKVFVYRPEMPQSDLITGDVKFTKEIIDGQTVILKKVFIPDNDKPADEQWLAIPYGEQAIIDKIVDGVYDSAGIDSCILRVQMDYTSSVDETLNPGFAVENNNG